MINIVFFLAFLINIVFNQTPEDCLVTDLEGFEDVNFNIYSGYLNVSEDESRKLHYVFLESQNNPINDNLLVWFNGGPGCSSMEGLISENGPRVILGNDDFLSDNEYSWNRNNNVLYLEGPPGAGFSVNYDSNYVYSDENSGIDFFTGFQEFLRIYKNTINIKNPIWFAGESYAGVYIPFFTKQVLDFNKQASAEDQIELKGIMIGNGVWNTNDDVKALYRENAFVKNNFFAPEQKSIFYDQCIDDRTSKDCVDFYKIYDNVTNNTDRYQIYNYTYSYQPETAQDRVIDPDQRQEQYFNTQSVRDALHIDNNIPFKGCNDTIGETYQKASNSTYLYPEFLDYGLQILTFSGNTDGVIPTDYSWYSINQLFTDYNIKLDITDKWRQWKNLPNQQVGGMYQEWQTSQGSKFSFAMVRGSGHMVPENQPVAAFYMMERFMNGEPL